MAIQRFISYFSCIFCFTSVFLLLPFNSWVLEISKNIICDQPLHKWLLVEFILALFTVFLFLWVVYSFSCLEAVFWVKISYTIFSLYLFLESAWFLVGVTLLVESNNCKTLNTQVWMLCVAMLVLAPIRIIISSFMSYKVFQHRSDLPNYKPESVDTNIEH